MQRPWAQALLRLHRSRARSPKVFAAPLPPAPTEDAPGSAHPQAPTPVRSAKATSKLHDGKKAISNSSDTRELLRPHLSPFAATRPPQSITFASLQVIFLTLSAST